MPLYKKVDYITNSWPTSGAVTTENSGLDLVGTASYVAADEDNLNYDGTPNGSFIEQDLATNGSWGIVGSGEVLQDPEEDHWQKMYIQPYLVDRSALPLYSAGTPANFRCMQIVSSGTDLIFTMYMVDGDGVEVTNQGINLLTGDFIAQDAREFFPNTGASLSSPQIPFNSWSELLWHVHYDSDSSQSVITLYLNGFRMSLIAGGDFNTQMTKSAIRSAMKSIFLNSSKFTGMKWRFAGGEVWTGNDITITPRDDLRHAEDDLQQAFLPDNDKTRTYSDGDRGLTMELPTGSLTWTPTNFVTGGVNLGTSRYVISGTSGNAGQVKSMYKLGNLPFNELGVVTVCIKSIRPNYSSTPSTFKFAIRDDGDTQDIIELTLESTNRRLQHNGADLLDGSGNPIVLDGDHYYGIYLHLTNTGKVYVSVNNLSVNFASEQSWFSAYVQDWTVQSLGIKTYDVTLGDANFDLEPACVLRWLTGSLMDSTSNANLNDVELTAPATYSVGNRVSKSMGRGLINEYIPASVSAGYLEQRETFNGKPTLFVSIGRSGNSMNSFNNQNINNNAFKYTHGVKFVLIDGSSINDIANTYADKSAVDTKLTTLEGIFANMIQALILNNNKVWLGDMVIRENATYNERSNELQKRYNNFKLQYFKENQTSDFKLMYSEVMAVTKDVPTVYWSGADDVHFDTGEYIYAKNMYRYRTIPPVVASTVCNPASGDVIIARVKEGETFRLNELDTAGIVEFDLREFIDSDAGHDLFELKIADPANIAVVLTTITLSRVSDGLYRWTLASGDLSLLQLAASLTKKIFYCQVKGSSTTTTSVFATGMGIHKAIKLEIHNSLG